MKNITTYITEHLEQLITESFNCDIFKKLDAQFKQLKSDIKKLYEDDPSWAPNTSGINFRNYIAYAHRNNINWDKITNDDVEEYAGSDKKAATKIRKMLRKSDNKPDIYLAFAENDKGILYAAADSRGMIIHLPYIHNNYLENRYRDPIYNVLQYKAVEIFTRAKTIYFIKLNNYVIKQTDANNPNNRREARTGMILQGDMDFYREIAEANLKRYQKELDSRHAKQMNSRYLDDYRELLNKCVDVAKDIADNPEKYSTKTYEFSYLMDAVTASTKYMREHISQKTQTATKTGWSDMNDVKSSFGKFFKSMKDISRKLDLIQKAVASA